MATEEKLKEMGYRQEVYKMGYANAVKDTGVCIDAALFILLVVGIIYNTCM